MNAGKVAGICFAAAVLAASLHDSWPMISVGLGGPDGSSPVLRPRRAVERFVPKGERVTVLRTDSADRPSQVCRSIYLSAAWAAGAGNVEEKRALDGDERYVLVAPMAFPPAALVRNPRYREFGAQDTGRIWIREDAPTSSSGDAESGARWRLCWREALGLVAPIGLAVLLVAIGLGGLPRPAAWIGCGAVLTLNALFALSHTFTGPCGTGVFGGRARALVESGWDLSKLADPNMGEYFQASYPPLQAVVTAVGYSIAGMCEEWITQLGPVVFLAAAYLVMTGMRRGDAGRAKTESAAWCMLIAAACATRPMVHATGNFCAEPLLLLVVASGWSVLRRGDDRGWFLIGLAGLVKNEGLIYAPAIAVAEALSGRLRVRGVVDLALGLVPVALWHVCCRFTGATLYDYAAPWQCDFAHASAAARELVLEVASHQWRYAFLVVVPAAAIRAAHAAERGPGRLRAAACAALPPLSFFAVFASGVCYAFSLSRSPDFAWHVSCLPRLIAPAAALALASAVRRG